MVAAAKLVHCAERGGSQIRGQALGFVKDHNAARNVVELSADGRAVGKQSFKKTDRRGDDDRGAPSGGQLPVFLR